MCTKDIQTVVYPDGQERTESTVTRCSKAPAGYECAQPRVFTYPKVYADARLPPTPRLTPSNSPRPSTPRGYASASDRESDHSRRSGGSGGSGRRRERYTSYHGTSDPSGAKVININRSGTGLGLGRQERILIVENPPTSRTPPQAFTMPFTAPSSPRSGYTMAADHYGRHARRDTLRPVIVDERPSRHVRFNEGAGPSSPSPYLGHRRTHSNESRNSYGPSSDDERRSARRSLRQETSDFIFPEADDSHRRRERRRERERAAAAAAAAPASSAEEQKLDRDLRKAERIAQMNSHIDARAAVPVPGLNRTTTDVAAEQRDRELRDAVRQMDINAAPLRRRDTGMSREDEAQKRRLEERMMPRRRATVGPGSRRNRVVYENGVYVWE